MWLKLTVGGAIVAFCTLLGYFAATKYRARKNFYTQFCAFNERYLAELRYARKPLGDFLRENSFSGEFSKTIRAFSADRETKVGYAFLTHDEQAFCSDYLSMLGRGDARAQSGYFSAQREGLLQKQRACEAEAKKRNELYLKLGLLAGLAFVILIL